MYKYARPSAILMCGLLLQLSAFAQQRRITGTVLSDEDGKPMQGVTVTNPQTKATVFTDASGKYTIEVQAGQQLVFTSVGYGNRSVTVSADQSNVSLRLTRRGTELDQVVVTALGITRSKRSLGYAANDVKGSDLAQTQRDNFVNSLAGRVPGVTVSGTSGMPGSSTSIQLRGINSLSGSNQPLFVIDGLPVNNETFQANNMVSQTENRTVDFSNRISDLNPNDIESLTILKGPEAAALYGIGAANGAIVITTKKGKSGRASISYDFTYGIEKIDNLPEVPRVYQRGANGVTSSTTFGAFGPRYPEGTVFYDNMNNFFRTGTVQKHNISLDGGANGYTYRLSAGYSSREGVVPTTKYDRFNVSLTGTAQLFTKLRAETNLQFINTKNTKVSKGANSFYLSLLTYPADVEMANYLNPNGTRAKFTTTASEIENPFFDVNKNKLDDRGNRVISNLSLIYDMFPWLSFTGRLGIDVSNNDYRVFYHPESARAVGTQGSLNVANQVNRVTTLTYFGEARKNFLDNRFKTTLRVGSAVYDYDDRTFATYGERFLDPDFNSINNATYNSVRGKQTYTPKRVVGVFGDLTMSYNDMFYMTVTGRNDWSSTLPVKNNSFFYPSASGSFVFTELMKNSKLTNVLTMGRIRASIAQVGKDARPFATTAALEPQQTTGGGYGAIFTAPNPELRPEKVTSREIGAELQFFKNRLSLDVAYYKSKSVDQIINDLRISYGTGYILKVINGGELENWGTEILLRGTPIQGKNFTWEASINYTKTDSRLTRLPEGVSEFYNSDTWLFNNVRNGARLGGPLTTLTALQEYMYNDAGQLLIDPTSGLPLKQSFAVWPVAGDRNPDFKMGVYNSFSYKRLNLNFLIDIKKGGDVFNATGAYMYNLGLHPLAVANREQPLVFTGVLRDGLENTKNPTPNNIVINPYYNNTFYTSSVIDQEFIERDVNWVRLRDITLSYRLPERILGFTKVIKSASIGVTATDLFMFTNYTGGDPGVNGTTVATGGSGSMGIDFGNLPVPKTFNFNVRVGF
ncbi:SusC/RagA family TonB-linked outer membrane protein [Flaviaesturariibacter flavus]|uniref:SusC/RagA family TonB-linked outer membrane protein n=1 Tax=Flaviaesturariibacter flavus TaxID=2502780 RepID=A0A4V2NWZ1_9BACT|nr:SusC/RagA family TonB-linked outer membrane protein [Flaviaesturariibacter flavus]TCJ19282.1 SusC/RagA family TonB-linked outer membrane protein [Flaviaesturariibacter flavus]